MTITATPSEISYNGNGATLSFSIPFVFETSADLKVYSTIITTGVITQITSGFTVTGGNGSIGDIAFSVAPAATVSITILDDPALTQPADYISNDAFPAETHERALDRVTRIAKRLYQTVQKTLRVADGDASSGDDLLLPTLASRASKFLAFDANGNPIAATAVSDGDALLRAELIAGASSLVKSTAVKYDITTAETAAGVTPIFYYQPLHPNRYSSWANWRAVMAQSTTEASQYNYWSREDTLSTAIGFNALKAEVDSSGGTQNTAVGHGVMAISNGSIRNTVIGADSLTAVTTGYENTVVGAEAATSLTVGTRNTAIGNRSLVSTTNENESTAVGASALYSANAAKNTAVGREAGYYITTGVGNTVMGYDAMLGDSTAKATGDFNAVFGYQALLSATTAARNVAMGFQALAIATTAYTNTCIGYGAGSAITTGQYNVIIGGASGSGIATLSNRLIIADGAGTAWLEGDSTGLEVVRPIKIQSGSYFLSNAANGYRFNNEANTFTRMTLTDAGALTLGAYGAGTLTTDASGNVTAVSDERVKSDIRPFKRGLSEVLGIEPILHGYTQASGLDQSKTDYAGFSAQNVLSMIPEAVDDRGEYLTLSDRPIIAALVNAVKELSERVKELELQLRAN